MIYAVIAAGGKGTRMNSGSLPKQFLSIGGKPVIAITLEKFLAVEAFEKIIVVCPEEWIGHTQKLISQHFADNGKIALIKGGSTRNETLIKAIDYIEETDGITEDTVVVTHDAVRPFVTEEIIRSHVFASVNHLATGTAIPATDTIFVSENKTTVTSVPDRSTLFHAQTPQTFNAKLLKELYLSLTEKEKELLTDACKIFQLKGYEVFLLRGDVQNIKITYPTDIIIGNAIIENEITNEQ